MAGFKKAKPAQAAIKMSMYGPPGSGKTFSALLFAEGIAKKTGKRVAFVDTERGTDFYAMEVKDRSPHPEAFDFDALYSRSIAEATQALHDLDPAEYGVVVIDSVSHLWDAAINAYTGPKTGAGTIPMWAWGKIKGPYKSLMKFLIDSPYHVFILGRQANVFEEDSTTGETKAAGVKMRAEGETAYEPHICLRMSPIRTETKGRKTTVLREQTVAAFAEKDRSGVLAGKMIEWPDFSNVIEPLMKLLHGEQGATPSDDDAARHDAEANADAEKAKAHRSQEIRDRFIAKVQLAETPEELKELGAKMTPKIKAEMTATHQAECRAAWLARDGVFKGKTNGQPAPNPDADDPIPA